MNIKMNELSISMRVLVIINSLVMILAGLILLIAQRYIVWLASAAVLVYGIHLIIRYFAMKDKRNGWDIILGLISVPFGIFLLFFSTPEAKIIWVLTIEIIVAIWFFIAGIGKIIDGFGSKKEGTKKSIWGIIGGIAMLIMGIIFLARPAFGSVIMVFTFAIFVGVSFIISGFTGIADALSGKKKETQEEKQEETPTATS